MQRLAGRMDIYILLVPVLISMLITLSLPHWRKFQFHGLPPGVASIFVEYSYLLTLGITLDIISCLSQIELEFDEAGNAFVYFLPAQWCSYLRKRWSRYSRAFRESSGVNTSPYAEGKPLKFFYPSGTVDRH